MTDDKYIYIYIIRIFVSSSFRVDIQWKSLTNTLSGLFCESINFIDETITTEPTLSFQSSSSASSFENNNDIVLRYGSLPHESVCTENLTPWLKLLPCKSKVSAYIILLLS